LILPPGSGNSALSSARIIGAIKIVQKTAAEAAREARVDYAKLAATTDADIRRQMIEDGEGPDADRDDWHPAPVQVRQVLKLTQAQIAALLGIPVATWRNWEQGRTAIDAPGRALMMILQREPEAVLRAMKHPAAAE
jgi:putative transcriptional regulator